MEDNRDKSNNIKNGGKERKGGLKRKLIWVVTVPLLIMGLVTMSVSYFFGYRTVSTEVEQGLRNLATATLFMYDDLYEEQISFTDNGDGTYKIDDGNIALASDTAYIDRIKDSTDIDISVLYYDIRLLTTLKDSQGNRLMGTVVTKKVVDDVMRTGGPVFYDELMVYNVNYYACYVPVTDKSGKFMGMIFAGKPTADVKTEVLLSVLPIMIVSVLMMLIGALIGAGEAKKLSEVIGKEKTFLGQIADGNLRANFDADILKRTDEIGEMGKFMVHVQRFIRDMIERDTLTKLYTRRIGETKMQHTRMGLIEDGVSFQLVMGDIDHFKRFNDTYGHDCGDLVLQTVAGLFNRSLIGKGYAVRWGGEEFIIVLEGMNYEEAYEFVKKLRESVINEVVEYKGELLSITMTFGLVPGSSDELETTIKSADKLLYIGKEGGRNRIVRFDEYDEIAGEGEAESEEVYEKGGKDGADAAAGAGNAGDKAEGRKNETIPKETMAEEDRLEALMRSM